MIRKLLPAFLALALLAPLSGQSLKLASVDMQRLFNDYYRTNQEQQDINIERARIQKDNNIRLEAIRNIETQLNDLRKELDLKDLTDKRRQDLTDQIRDLFEDGKHQERARVEFLERRNQALNEKMGKRMRSLLAEIRQLVSEKATEGDYDYIFDSSGSSRQGIPFVLHSKKTADLTEKLITELNKDQEKK